MRLNLNTSDYLCLNPACGHRGLGRALAHCPQCGAALSLGERVRTVGWHRASMAVGWDLAEVPPQPCLIQPLIWLDGVESLQALGQQPQLPSVRAVIPAAWGVSYLIQTLDSSPSLADRIAQDGPWSAEAVRSLLLDLLPVVQILHDRGLIHGDLRPDTLLIPAAAPPRLLSLGSVIPQGYPGHAGSAGYSAPEQVLGQATLASDIYSLGVSALFALTGQHPFDLYSASDDRWIWRSYVSQPLSLRMGQRLDRMVARALGQRYPTAAIALQAWQGFAPTESLARVPDPDRNPPTPEPEPTTWQVIAALPVVGRGTVMAVSGDGRWLALGDRPLQVWALPVTGIPQGRSWGQGCSGGGHRDHVVAVQWQGETLWSASPDGTVKGWQVGRRRPLVTVTHPGWGVTAIAVTAWGGFSGSGDGVVARWPLSGGQGQGITQGGAAVTAIAAVGVWVVGGTAAGELWVWRGETGDLGQRWQHPTRVVALAGYRETGWLWLGDGEGMLWRYGVGNGEGRQRWGRCGGEILQMVISGEGRWGAIATTGGTVELWDLSLFATVAAPQRQRPVAILQPEWGARAIALAPQGSQLFTLGADQILRLWQGPEGEFA